MSRQCTSVYHLTCIVLRIIHIIIIDTQWRDIIVHVNTCAYLDAQPNIDQETQHIELDCFASRLILRRSRSLDRSLSKF